MPNFRRKKKKSESAGEGSRSAGEGSRSYRRIRGLLTGESRRERKAKRAAERAAAAALGKPAPPVPEGDDEDETVYGVNVENNSVVQTPDRSASAKRGLLTPARHQDDDDEITFETAALQVILLLMDPGTRRFELLQLEFDSNHAIVKDVLAEVPLSVTEEVLRKQNYSGVCDRTGQELYVSTRLSEACGPADILIAIPENVPAMECARLAKPILQDKNVVEMVILKCHCQIYSAILNFTATHLFLCLVSFAHPVLTRPVLKILMQRQRLPNLAESRLHRLLGQAMTCKSALL